MKVETQDKFGGKATQNLSQTKKLYNIYLDFILKWGGGGKAGAWLWEIDEKGCHLHFSGQSVRTGVQVFPTS